LLSKAVIYSYSSSYPSSAQIELLLKGISTGTASLDKSIEELMLALQ